MARSHILQTNWFDYPQYYDIAFQAPTQREADFVEAACRKYCPFAARRFLHLLTEQAARGHLRCIAGSLRPGGIYVLGLHLLPLDVDKEDGLRWTTRRGETKVTVTLCVLRIDLRR